MASEQATSGWAVASGVRALSSSPQQLERLLLVLAGIFVSLGALTLELADLDHWSLVHWSLVVVWTACFGTAHVVLGRSAPERDPLLLPLASLLTGWGLLLVARLADESFLLRQSIWLVVMTKFMFTDGYFKGEKGGILSRLRPSKKRSIEIR